MVAIGILVIGLAICGGLGIWGALAQQPKVEVALRDQPVSDPTGTYSLIWRGATFDVGMPGGSARFPTERFQSQGWVPLNVESVPLPISVLFDGRTLWVAWFEPSNDEPTQVYNNYYCRYWKKLGYAC
jgi:hypothetical protein